MKNKILILPLFLLSFFLMGQNLIVNGGFEQYSNRRPVGWIFDRDLAFDAHTADKHSGRYSARVWANSGSFYIIKNTSDTNAIDVKGGAEYKFSYWHKGDLTNDSGTPMKNIIITASWYKDNTLIKRDYLANETVITSPKEWQEKVIQLIAPKQANQLGISVRIQRGRGYVLFDDFSLIFIKDGDAEQINPPTGVEVDNYQREIEVRWDKELDKDLHWEVSVDGKTPVKTYTNSYIIENLEPSTLYKVKVRSVKNGATSEYTNEISQRTSGFEYPKDSPNRVPYIRTFNEEVISSEVLTLYFTDLVNKDAKISYFSDDVEIKPKGNQLTFPKKGKQKFKVIIEESPEHIWETEYDLTVK